MPIFIKRKLCWVFGRISKILFIFSCISSNCIQTHQTVNSNFHCHQLMKLDVEIKEMRSELATRKGVIFHQDNGRPHTSLVTREKLLELGWEVMPHSSNSPDLAPSDYHLFRSLQNHLNGKTFDSNEAVKNKLIQFFACKNQTFYESEIMKLTERWQKVIE